MRILLDTHIAIWAILNDKRLKEEARKLIENPDNAIYYSAISALEVDMKNKSRGDGSQISLYVKTSRNRSLFDDSQYML